MVSCGCKHHQTSTGSGYEVAKDRFSLWTSYAKPAWKRIVMNPGRGVRNDIELTRHIVQIHQAS